MTTLAPQDQTEQYREQVDQVLSVLGFPEALVTDESMLGDFTPIEGEDEWLKEVQKKLGQSELTLDDYVVDVVRKLNTD